MKESSASADKHEPHAEQVPKERELAWLLTPSEVGAVLELDTWRVVRWIAEGYLRSTCPASGHVFVRIEDLVTFLDEHRVPVPAALRPAASGTPNQ